MRKYSRPEMELIHFNPEDCVACTTVSGYNEDVTINPSDPDSWLEID